MTNFLIPPVLDGDSVIGNGLQCLAKFNPWSETLRKYIEKSNLQQKELAEQINVSPSTINMWCKGSRLPNSEMIYLLSSALHLPEEQDRLFRDYWLWTKRIRDCMPMLELAAQNNDFEYVKRILAII